jgi:hypothetical protein
MRSARKLAACGGGADDGLSARAPLAQPARDAAPWTQHTTDAKQGLHLSGGVHRRRHASVDDNTVTTSTLSHASSALRKPRKLDDLDAP